jgi:hypothetical protein
MERDLSKINEFKQKTSESAANKDNDANKLFVYDILRYFGLNFQEISDSLKYPLHIINHQLEGQ